MNIKEIMKNPTRVYALMPNPIIWYYFHLNQTIFLS